MLKKVKYYLQMLCFSSKKKELSKLCNLNYIVLVLINSKLRIYPKITLNVEPTKSLPAHRYKCSYI